jgi:hypothetical protein
MVTYAMLAGQITLLDALPTKLTPLLRYACGVFAAPKKVNSFAIKQIQPLFQEHRVRGYLCDGQRTLPPALSFSFVKSFICRSYADFAANPFIYRTYANRPGVWDD